VNAFSTGNIAVAGRCIDNALAYIEQHAETLDARLIGLAYAEVRKARGCIVASVQLEELEATMGRAPTEPPPPALRVVR